MNFDPEIDDDTIGRLATSGFILFAVIRREKI